MAKRIGAAMKSAMCRMPGSTLVLTVALLTGRNPYRTGFFYIAGRNTHLRNEEITLAEILRERGYQTSFWGKWHLSEIEKDRRDEPGPGDQGFDYWMGTTLNAFDGPANTKKFIKIPMSWIWFYDVDVNVRKKKHNELFKR